MEKATGCRSLNVLGKFKQDAEVYKQKRSAVREKQISVAIAQDLQKIVSSSTAKKLNTHALRNSDSDIDNACQA